ncbi:hypothetical protein DFH08DRAFT_825977 [Mycena albidolilacea]|uniref:Uncharacterized protein n=1 Tax=Mycena albidolilacea TaxID=1033008 RepID=A0AAD7E8M8_9AGAR|nr:hypothetical protein DFH08DRAFT_825977 [Mycena albidolilacea]
MPRVKPSKVFLPRIQVLGRLRAHPHAGNIVQQSSRILITTPWPVCILTVVAAPLTSAFPIAVPHKPYRHPRDLQPHRPCSSRPIPLITSALRRPWMRTSRRALGRSPAGSDAAGNQDQVTLETQSSETVMLGRMFEMRVTRETEFSLELSSIWAKATWLSWMVSSVEDPIEYRSDALAVVFVIGTYISSILKQEWRSNNVQFTVMESWQQTCVPTSVLGMETAKGPFVGGQPQLKADGSYKGFCSATNTSSKAALVLPDPVNAVALPTNMAAEMAGRRDLLKNMLSTERTYGVNESN